MGHAATRALVVAAPDEERRQLETLLCRERVLASIADSFESAIAAVTARRFEIVLSDMALGGPWEGLELARWLLVHQQATGIILLSDTFPWIAANSPLASATLRPWGCRYPACILRPARPAIGPCHADGWRRP